MQRLYTSKFDFFVELSQPNKKNKKCRDFTQISWISTSYFKDWIFIKKKNFHIPKIYHPGQNKNNINKFNLWEA